MGKVNVQSHASMPPHHHLRRHPSPQVGGGGPPTPPMHRSNAPSLGIIFMVYLSENNTAQGMERVAGGISGGPLGASDPRRKVPGTKCTGCFIGQCGVRITSGYTSNEWTNSGHQGATRLVGRGGGPDRPSGLSKKTQKSPDRM